MPAFPLRAQPGGMQDEPSERPLERPLRKGFISQAVLDEVAACFPAKWATGVPIVLELLVGQGAIEKGLGFIGNVHWEGTRMHHDGRRDVRFPLHCRRPLLLRSYHAAARSYHAAVNKANSEQHVLFAFLLRVTGS